MPYVVMVDDNYHFMDQDQRYRHGEFDDPDIATEHCRRIVDEYLASAIKPGMEAAELWESYKMFGEDPFIVSKGVPPVSFSAWAYAEERCAALCL